MEQVKGSVFVDIQRMYRIFVFIGGVIKFLKTRTNERKNIYRY